MERKLFFPLCFFLIFISTLSFADYLKPYQRAPRKSTLFMSLETQAYYSQFNFSPSGQWTPLDNNAFISFLDYKLSFTYHPYSWIKLTPYTRAKTYYNSFLNENESALVPFYPTEVGGALSFPFRMFFIASQPEIDISFPLDSQRGLIQQPIISDESLTITLSSLFQITIQRRFLPFFKIGVQYRGKELLSLLQGQIGLKYRDRVWEIGGLVGVQNSLLTQSLPQSKERWLKEFNSGSLKFASVSPFSVGTSVWADLRVSTTTSFFAQYGIDLYGMQYAQGHQTALGLKIRFLRKRKTRTYKRNRFKEETEDIDSLLNNESDQELMREIEKLQ